MDQTPPPFEIGNTINAAFPDGLADDEKKLVVEPTIPEEELAMFQSRVAAMNALATMPDFWRSRFDDAVRAHGQTRRGRRAIAALLRAYTSWRRRTDILRAHQAEARVARESARLSELAEDYGIERHAAAPAIGTVG